MQRDNQIWSTKLDKVMRIEEFKQNQSAAIQTMKFNTGKEGWVGKLEKIIKASFKDVGKGWFNINENQKETYEFGKLKKFLTLVNFMMQDTVLNICKDSVNQFVEFMLDFIPEETLITNTATVKNRFKYKHADSTEDESDGDLQINDDDLDEVKLCKEWVNSQFQRNKDPEPLF